ncbi:MAG: diacylglycerol kinase family protein [Alphaproteobacteria bacterium]|nr:diacylglycerol kinase family protein [Alphaproteobacteria bacterium]
MPNPFTIIARLKSISFALAGIATMLRTQHNAWIHLAATIAVIAAGLWFQISSGEWVAVVLAIVVVWMAEGLNTAFELLCDVASPQFHPLVKQAKDVAAAAVLIAAVGAVVIAALIFWPRLF